MVDIEANLNGKREPRARYTSFDYCFNYFQSHREQGKLLDLLRGDALQLSCLHLCFYLASWGMLRGSSELLQRSVRSFIPLVEVSQCRAPRHGRWTRTCTATGAAPASRHATCWEAWGRGRAFGVGCDGLRSVLPGFPGSCCCLDSAMKDAGSVEGADWLREEARNAPRSLRAT